VVSKQAKVMASVFGHYVTAVCCGVSFFSKENCLTVMSGQRWPTEEYSEQD